MREVYSIPVRSVQAGSTGVETIHVPVLNAIGAIPDALDSLLLIGDIQAVDRDDVPPQDRRLGGIRVAEELALLGQCGLLPSPDRTGVLLTGDLFTDLSLSKRGGTGDVIPVWRAFSNAFRWVVGVAGNHDLFGNEHGLAARLPSGCGTLLDGDIVERDGLRIGGVSGIIGNNAKPWRKPVHAMKESIGSVLQGAPDIVLIHVSPGFPDVPRRGERVIGEVFDTADFDGLVASGHVHCHDPLMERGNTLFANVEFRVLALTRTAIPVL